MTATKKRIIEPTLTEQAHNIIMQKAVNDEDIFRLEQIKRQMAQLYRQYCEKVSETERNYNIERVDYYFLLRESKKFTQGDADVYAKRRAETRYGDYRKYKERCKGMKAEIDAIREFCIAYHTREKHTMEAVMNSDSEGNI